MRIDYRSPHGAISGAYEATVEVAGTVMTMESSGDAELAEVDQYRVVRLEKAFERS